MPPKKYREQISTIKLAIDPQRHSQLEKQWSELKEAFDLIADQLDVLPENPNEVISVDTRVLPETTKTKLRRALSNLVWDDVVGCINDHPSGVMQTTTRFRRMLDGQDIVVGNQKSFEKYRRDIVRVLEFIKRDAKKKFGKIATDSGVALHSLKRKSNTIDLVFPELVKWEKVTLKLKEGLKGLEIFYNDKHICTTDHVALGFYFGEKERKSDQAWNFLCALAVLAKLDIRQATTGNLRNMLGPKGEPISVENVHQIKRTLVKKLCILFKTEDIPFHDCKNFYSPKFKILPEAFLRREELWSQGSAVDENRLHDNQNIEAPDE